MRSTMLASFIIFICIGIYTHFIKVSSPDWLAVSENVEDFKVAFFILTSSFGAAYYLLGMIVERSLPIKVSCSKQKTSAWVVSLIQVMTFNLTWVIFSVSLIGYGYSLVVVYLTYIAWDRIHCKQLDEIQLKVKNKDRDIESNRGALISVLRFFDWFGLSFAIIFVGYAHFKEGIIKTGEFFDSGLIIGSAMVFIIIPLIAIVVRGNIKELFSMVDGKGNLIFEQR